MLKRTLCFESDGNLFVKDKQLCFDKSKKGLDVKQAAPVEDIGFVILEGRHINISTYALDLLSANGAVVVVCDELHLPTGIYLPMAGHTATQRITEAQLSTTKTQCAQLWKQTVVAKIRNQAECLRRGDKVGAEELESISKFVTADDVENREGRAAAIYFKSWGIVRKDTRDVDVPMPNPALNYGYALLRAAMARALVGSGMLCVKGIHHHNQYNPLALADDIMEPYRPMIDDIVFTYIRKESRRLEDGVFNREFKIALLSALASDVKIGGVVRPLAIAMTYTSSSLAACFEHKESKIKYPEFV